MASYFQGLRCPKVHPLPQKEFRVQLGWWRVEHRSILRTSILILWVVGASTGGEMSSSEGSEAEEQGATVAKDVRTSALPGHTAPAQTP